MGIAFEQLPPWSNRKEDIVKFLKMRGVEIRIEREIPDEAQERENQPAKIRQLMEEMKPQARSKCFWLRGRFNKRIGRWLVVTNCVPRLGGGDCRFWIPGHLELVFSQKGLHGRGPLSSELFPLFHACDKARRHISTNRNSGIMTSSMHLSSDRPKIRTNHNAWVIQLIV